VYTIDSKIQHVESFAQIPEESTHESPCRSHWHLTRNEEKEGSEEWCKTRCEYGRGGLRNYVDEHWLNYLQHVGVEEFDEECRIKPLDGHELPFDFNADSDSIDLVVAKTECETAFEILEDFDLNICKASFDGNKFHIPDPHLTFACKTTMEPLRKTLVTSYARHWQQGGLFSAIVNVRNEHPDLPFYSNLDSMEYLVEPEVPLMNFGVQMRMQFHNFVWKLIQRLKKHQRRGIEVIEAPDVSSVRIEEMSFF